MKIKISFVLILTLIIFSCKDLPQEEVIEIQSYFEDCNTIPPEDYNFCNDDSSYCGKAVYNTDYGYALFAIPVPKGSDLKFDNINSDNQKQIINYTCTVENYHNNVYLQPKLITGLKKIKGGNVFVSVTYKFTRQECMDASILTEKKKTTPIQGQPLILK